MTLDHYATLKVSRDAPPEVIRASYAALMRQAHPDLGGQGGPVATDLNEARSVLLDPDRRAEYDAALGSTERREAEPATAEAEPDPAWGEDSDWVETGQAGDPQWCADDNAGPPQPPPPPAVTPPPYPTDQPPYASPGVNFNGGAGADYAHVANTAPAARLLWRGASPAERLTGGAWLALSLVGPVASVVDAVTHPGSQNGWVGNAIIYAVLFGVSFHVARRRILSVGMPKRYVLLIGASLLLSAVTTSDSSLGALYFGAWTLLFVAATETRRRRLWRGAN